MKVWIQNPFDNLPCEGYRRQRFWMMSEAFAAAGHRVVFWTSDFSHANKMRRRLIAPPPTDFDLRLIPTRPYARNIGWARVRSHRDYARAWLRLARTETERPDVIITSVPTITAAVAARELAREFGAKTVVDVMDAWPETFERLAPRGFRALARLLLSPLRRQVRRLYREADLVTGVCARYRSLVGRMDYVLAYHGVEIGTEPSLADRDGKSGIRLVYAGNLGRTYDLETVLRAVAANSDFTLDIAGHWERETPPRVTAHGYLGQDELRRLLESCDVGIIPMPADSWVGIPYKLCDYTRAGLRVVSSLGGESSEFLARYRCGETYCTGDAESFAAAVRRAVAEARANARRLCVTEFDAARIYADYVKAVEGLFDRMDGGRKRK